MRTSALIVALAVQAASAAEDWTGFLGGPERSATVSGEGLLKTWPTNGPVMVWESRAIGVSMGEVLIVGSNVYAWGQTLPEPERDTDKSQEAAAGADRSATWKQPVAQGMPHNLPTQKQQG
jgi:hypothetical protein